MESLNFKILHEILIKDDFEIGIPINSYAKENQYK